MSYLNEDQEDHCRDLASLPLEKRSWCGWYLAGECAKFHEGRCAESLTCADKCLPCGGYGKRWIQRPKDYETCPDCGGSGLATV